MALAKYYEDNQEIAEERLCNANKNGEYIKPIVQHQTKSFNANQKCYFEIIFLGTFPAKNAENFCLLQISKKAYIIRRKGRMVKFDTLNDAMHKINARQTKESNRTTWHIPKKDISLDELLKLLKSCGIRVLVNPA